MTNPDNIVRVRARNGGRASVYEANGWCQGYSSGLFEGNGVLQNTSADMNVLVGGSSSKPDVVLAENPAGYKIALDLVGQQAVAITAPATNSRISAIVAYTDDLSLQSTEDTVTGSPASCGLIVVNGTASASPSEPTDTQIRAAITSDGATGSQACYAVIATILVPSDTTIITSDSITINNAGLKAQNIDFATFPGLTYSPQSLSSTKSVGSTWTNYDSYTIPASGLYFVRLTFNSDTAGSTEMRSEARNVLNGTTNFNVIGDWSTSNYAGNNFAEGNTEIIQWFNAGDIIKSQGKNQNWTGSLTVTMYIQQIY